MRWTNVWSPSKRSEYFLTVTYKDGRRKEMTLTAREEAERVARLYEMRSDVERVAWR